MGRTMPLYTGVETLRHAGDHIQWGGTRLGADGFKNMPAGKASFTVIDPPDCLAPDGQWMLTACCDEPPEDSADSDSTHGADHYGRDELFMNAGDMANMGLADGAHVRVHNDHGSWYARLYSMSIKPGVVQASWPECSAVIPFSMDSNTSESGCTAAVHIETR
jgi:hypothetical protein